MRRVFKFLLRGVGFLLLVGLVFVAARVLIIEANAQTFPAEALAGPDGQFIDVNGASLYVIDKGEMTQPAVLLLHGFGGSTYSWRYTIDPLVEAGYRVVAFDRPPYGLADKNPEIDYSTTNYVELTAGLMDALAIESAVLVGHSAGGGVIAQFVLTYPERVDALVFVAGAVRVPDMVEPTSDPDGNSRGGSVFAPVFDVASRLDPNSPFAQIAVRQFVNKDLLAGIARANYYDPNKVTDEEIAGYTQVLDVDGWEGAFLRLFTMRDEGATMAVDWSGLKSVAAPTLIVWGVNDPVVPLYVGEALNAYMEGSTFITYDQVGHLPMEEHIAPFNADLINWLTQNRPTDS